MRFRWLFCLGLFSTFAFGQERSIKNISLQNDAAVVPITAGSTSDNRPASVPLQPTPPTPITLFDAPFPTAQSNCTQDNAKLCPECMHGPISDCPAGPVTERSQPERDHFFSMGDGRRALRPDKKSWLWFAAAQATMWVSGVAAVKNSPASNQGADSAYPAAAVLTGMDLLFFKTIGPVWSVGRPIYATVYWSRAALK
jgi:hypothetical protein